MADLKERDRGQLILIAAFALAVTFIALALVVNSAIFTENLASRGETGGSDDAITLRQDVEHGVGASIESANVYNTSDLDDGVDKGIGNVNTAYSKQNAAGTAIVNVSKTGPRRYGSRIAQNESGGRLFTNATGREDWTVVEDIEPYTSGENATRAFVMNITKSDLRVGDSGAFQVVVDEWNGADVWRLTLWQDTSQTDIIHLRVEGSALPGTPKCSRKIDNEFVHIDVTGGTVAGEPCDALRYNDTNGDGDFENYRFGSGAGEHYNISFENGRNVSGNYSLVTTNTSIDSSNNLHEGVGPSSPYGDEAVYSVVVEYIYKSPKLNYETDVRVAPGEPRD